MTAVQLKSEIEKILDKIPEDSLKDILEYLKTYESIAPEDTKLAEEFRKILNEDRELLKRLAE